MSNNTVKIGVSSNLEKRKATIENASGLKIIQCCYTELLDKEIAYKIEHICHKNFKKNRLNGEFFNISFEEAVLELQKHANLKF